MTFIVASRDGTDIDPEVEALCRRVLAVRRHWCKFPGRQSCILADLASYAARSYVGTDTSRPRGLRPAPPPGAPGRKHSAPGFRPFGPIGVLLLALHRAAAVVEVVDDHVLVHMEGYPSLDLFRAPVQLLRPAITALAVRARCRAAADARDSLQGAQDVDHAITLGALGSESGVVPA